MNNWIALIITFAAALGWYSVFAWFPVAKCTCDLKARRCIAKGTEGEKKKKKLLGLDHY